MKANATEPEDELSERTCIVSREIHDPRDLIRFVRSPDGAVVADLRRRLPGRGAHVGMNRRLVDEAMRRKLFARAFKREINGPTELGAEVDGLLVRSALGSLGLARKAGQLVTGATKVDAAIRSGQALALVQASDGAPDGLRKIDGARHAAELGGAKPIRTYRLIASEELGLALGGVNVIHAAILAGEAGTAAVLRLDAIVRYRGDGVEPEPGGGRSAQTGVTAATTSENDKKLGAPTKRRPGQDEGRGTEPAQEAEA